MNLSTDDVRRMMPGRDMDTLIRDLFFPLDPARCRDCGWPLKADLDDGCTAGVCRMVFWQEPRPKRYDEPPPYSGDGIIDPAWQIVLKFGPGVRLAWHAYCPETGETFVWSCALLSGGQEFAGYGSYAQLAICRASLLTTIPMNPVSLP